MTGHRAPDSRLTFRSAAGDVAWQRQLRDKHLAEGAPDADLSLKSAVVRPVSYHLAKQVILKYEWLGTMAQTNKHYGIFFGNYCAGVVCFGLSGTGANLNAWQEWKLNSPNDLAYLARGANVHWSPPGANSKLVSIACRLLAKDTSAKLVVAYSDTDAGEIGTIYQACNWICVGRGSSTLQWVNPQGRVYDAKYPSDLRRNDNYRFPRSFYVDQLKRAGWTEQDSNPKWRYVYVLDKSDTRLIALVNSKKKFYPKREHASVVEQ